MKSVTVFKGIKGLVSSGPGTKKMINDGKIRPEKNEGAKIPQEPMKTMPKMTMSKTPMKKMPGGKVHVSSNIRPEGAIKRDSASVVKP